MPMLQGWGRSVPAEIRSRIAATWGARAIYTNQIIDLLPDRQSWEPTGDEHKPVRANLLAWINSKGLPFLRKEAKRLYPDESRVVTLDDGAFHIEASPQASYGYLYIRAWELTLAKTEAAHTMLKLKRGGYVAFAERENRHLLEELRKTDPRMQRGRIAEVLQMLPSTVTEGIVYEGS